MRLAVTNEQMRTAEENAAEAPELESVEEDAAETSEAAGPKESDPEAGDNDIKEEGGDE